MASVLHRQRPYGYFVSHSPTYSVTFAVRGCQVDGKTDQAVALMKYSHARPNAKKTALELNAASKPAAGTKHRNRR